MTNNRHPFLILSITLLFVITGSITTIATGHPGEDILTDAIQSNTSWSAPGGTGEWLTAVQQEIHHAEGVMEAETLETTPNWTDQTTQQSAYFGLSVGTAGDVNGDGYMDVIVGAPGYDNGQSEEGRVYVYYGSSSGLSTTADWIVEGDQYTAELGQSVGTAGDVNGDGYSDVIIGARRYTNGEEYEGGAFAFYGSETGLSATPDWSAEGDVQNAWFGISVGTAGDVNGDGYSDVIVGAGMPVLPVCINKAFVYYGSETGLSTTADWVGEHAQSEACFGLSVGTAGDVNGDAYSDVIVGAPYYGNEETEEGAAYVYLGSETGLSGTPDWSVESNQDEAYFGTSVGTTGDVNGDGYSDVVVGSPNYSNGETNEGRSFVYYGSETGLTTSPDWTSESDQAGSFWGTSGSTAGDVNCDGYADVIIGAPRYKYLYNFEGAAFLFIGSATGLSSTAIWTTSGNQAYNYYGYAVGTAGDVNGNGCSDVIIGAFGFEYGECQGKAFIYHDTRGFRVFLPLLVKSTP